MYFMSRITGPRWTAKVFDFISEILTKKSTLNTSSFEINLFDITYVKNSVAIAHLKDNI